VARVGVATLALEKKPAWPVKLLVDERDSTKGESGGGSMSWHMAVVAAATLGHQGFFIASFFFFFLSFLPSARAGPLSLS
jgi:hypothetical protein